MTPVTSPAYQKLKPKVLGTVQIMIGIITLLLGIVLTLFFLTIEVLTPISGITLWGSLIFISSGALTVATANHQNHRVVKASLGMNVISAVVAGSDIILFSVDMVFTNYLAPWNYNHYYGSDHSYRYLSKMFHGIYGVLLVLALLELIISIYTSVFACKVINCTVSKPTYSPAVTTEVMYTLQIDADPDYYYNEVPEHPAVITNNV